QPRTHRPFKLFCSEKERFMRSTRALVTALCAGGLAATILMGSSRSFAAALEGTIVLAQADQSSGTRKKRSANPGLQIACTRVGCNPIPRGCHIEKEFSFDGTPTGYDLVVCP